MDYSTPDYHILITLGGVLLLGLFTSVIGKHTALPRVTLLLLFGILLGKEGLNLIPATFNQWFDIVATMALLMVGFLLGGRLSKDSLRNNLRQTLWISLTSAMVTACVVSFGLYMLGVPTTLAILLGSIASATAPAAILDVVMESDEPSRFGNLLLAIVALDDAWALILFSVGIALASSLTNGSIDTQALLHASREIFGALALGIFIGIPAAYLTGRLKPGQPIISEALGLVFICGGLAMFLEVSFLISAMALGATIANLAKHHDYPFHAIEGIESLFMVVFFVLAGASLELVTLTSIGWVGVIYIFYRTLGKLTGGFLGSCLGQSPRATRQWIGAALLPQAGVAIGMALVAATYFPEYRQQLLPIVLSTTIFFEIIGPIFTRLALTKARQPKLTKIKIP